MEYRNPSLDRKPLSDEEKKVITDAGWVFLREDYIEIPDDWDGCMAHGIGNIRRILRGIKKRLEKTNDIPS